MTIDSKKLEALTTKCIQIAKNSWSKNFNSSYTSGDCNREAIGMIAATILKYVIENDKEQEIA